MRISIINKVLISIILLIIFLPSDVYAQTKEDLESQKSQVEKDIEYTNTLLDKTKSEKQTSIKELELINKNIKQRNKLINNINYEIRMLNSEIKTATDSIDMLKILIENLQEEYAKMIIGTWNNRNTYKRLSYIFDSDNLSQAFKRMTFFKSYSDKRKEFYNEIVAATEELEKKQISYANNKKKKEGLVAKESQEKRKLESDKEEQNKLVQGLSKKEKELKKKIQQQQAELNKLTKEIEKIIAAEVKERGGADNRLRLTPEEQLLSTNFAGNKGKLPWPTERGVVSRPFGEQAHPVLKSIKINNPGINIVTEEKSYARCVFDGEVITIKQITQYNVVIVRHGEYLSVYSNLGEVFVTVGQKVKSKDLLGIIGKDPAEGTTEIHFEIWKGSTTQDPELWLAR